jgi:ABC-type multidrug transport system fused ATPase/permease subunit
MVLYWMRAGFWFLCHYLTFYPALRMLFDLRMAIFKHLQGLSLRFYQEYRTASSYRTS